MSDTNQMIEGNPASDANLVQENSIYSMLNYLPLYDMRLKTKGMTVEELLQKAETYVAPTPKAQIDFESNLATVKAMIEANNMDTSAIKIQSYSWEDGKDYSKNNPKGFQAVTFVKDGVATIAYRGTPDRAWVDNAFSLASVLGIGGPGAANSYIAPDGTRWGPMSAMDKASLKYAEYAMRTNSGLEYNSTGHSKGGHEAMLAGMVFAGIKNVYSFDGYGVSPEFESIMSAIMGKEYDKRREKIIAVNGQNDYVNILGEALAYAKNMVFIDTKKWDGPNCTAVSYPHDMRGMVDPNTGLLWGIHPGGKAESSKFLQVVVNVVLRLPAKQRNVIVLGSLFLVQIGMKRELPIGTFETIVSAVCAVILVAFVGIIVIGGIILLAKHFPFILAGIIILGLGALFVNWLKKVMDGGRHAAVNSAGYRPYIKVNTDTMDGHINTMRSYDAILFSYYDRAAALAQRGWPVGLQVPNCYNALYLAQRASEGMANYLSKARDAIVDADKKTANKIPG